jgi:hypothetical protein
MDGVSHDAVTMTGPVTRALVRMPQMTHSMMTMLGAV